MARRCSLVGGLLASIVFRISSQLDHASSNDIAFEGFSYSVEADRFLADPDALESHVASTFTPKCWKSATRLLFELNSSLSSTTDSTGLCKDMTEQQQKFLALEIAKCHLGDLGLELYQKTDFVHDNCYSQLPRSLELMFACMKFLSPAGVNAYTHYVSNVQMLCTRLTHEVFDSYQRESHAQLLQKFREMSSESVAEISALRNLLSETLVDFSEIPAQLRDEMTQELLALWNANVLDMTEGLQESLHIQLDHKLQSSTTHLLQSLSDHWGQLRDEMTRREKEYEARHLEALAHQQEQIANMSAIVMETTQKMKPLSSVESLVAAVVNGYGWITTGIYILCAFNVTWMLTSLSFCKSARKYMFAVLWVEAAVEVLVRTAAFSDTFPIDNQYFIQDIRVLAICLKLLIWICSVLWSVTKWMINAASFRSNWKMEGDHEAPNHAPLMVNVNRARPQRSSQLITQHHESLGQPAWPGPDSQQRIVLHPHSAIEDSRVGTLDESYFSKMPQSNAASTIPLQETSAHNEKEVPDASSLPRTSVHRQHAEMATQELERYFEREEPDEASYHTTIGREEENPVVMSYPSVVTPSGVPKNGPGVSFPPLEKYNGPNLRAGVDTDEIDSDIDDFEDTQMEETNEVADEDMEVYLLAAHADDDQTKKRPLCSMGDDSEGEDDQTKKRPHCSMGDDSEDEERPEKKPKSDDSA